MQGSPRIDELRQKFHENPRRYFAPLANEYRKAGDPEQAIAICRAHLAQQPGHMSGHVVYGQALFDAQRIDEARTVFEKALSLDPDNPIVLRQLGDIARQRGETAEAKHWYSRALDADPHDPEVAAYIAELTEPLTEATEEPTVERPQAAETAEAAAPAEAAETAEAVETSEPELEVVESGDQASRGIAEEEVVAAAGSHGAETSPDTIEVVDRAGDGELTDQTFESETVESPAEEDVAETAAQPAEASTAPEAVEDGSPPGDPEDADGPIAEIPVTPLVVPLADVAWRKTPSHEDSPFVTRTMAELYAKQGYRSAALDVYRQLALNNPDDQEIRARMRELADDPGAAAEATAAVESTAGDSTDMRDQQVTEAEEPMAESTAASAEPTIDSPEDWSTLPEDIVYAPSSEDLNLEVEPDSPATDEVHFTELELSGGDTWDTDAWGAGFSSEESTHLEIDTPDVPPEAPSAPPRLETIESLTAAEQQDAGVEAVDRVPGVEQESETEAPAEPEPAAATDQPDVLLESETPVVQEAADAGAVVEAPVAAEDPVVAETPPDIIEEPFPVKETATVPEASAEEEPEAQAAWLDAEPYIAPEPAEEHEPEMEPDDEPHLVAYSPQPPDDEDLAHYEPKGPTVREFFATLGARKPPAREVAQSFTARAAVPAHEAPAEYPLAATAFADLFPDSAVAEEDTRAAFALSGAMTSSPPVAIPVPSVPAAESRTPPPAAAAPDVGQESEEEIRRFREWLDGLAES